MNFDVFIEFLIVAAIIWLASLAFVVFATMHIVRFFHLKINVWLSGGIAAVVWIIFSYMFVTFVGE